MEKRHKILTEYVFSCSFSLFFCVFQANFCMQKKNASVYIFNFLEWLGSSNLSVPEVHQMWDEEFYPISWRRVCFKNQAQNFLSISSVFYIIHRHRFWQNSQNVEWEQDLHLPFCYISLIIFALARNRGDSIPLHFFQLNMIKP